MPLFELLTLAGAMTAPAFFLAFLLAALGAPMLSLLLLLASLVRSMSHTEAFARRLLRMALSCLLPALLAGLAALGLSLLRVSWLRDWLAAAPAAPSLLGVFLLAYGASLFILRLSRQGYASHSRQGSPVFSSLVLSLLAAAIAWLVLSLGASLAAQAEAVLAAPMEEGITLAPLHAFDPADMPALLWALLACLPLSLACAAALILEYLLVLRDREPFGRETLGHLLRMGARWGLRAGLVCTGFALHLWLRLTESSVPADTRHAATALLLVCGACALLMSLCSGVLSRSNRPYERAGLIHAGALLVWLGLSALLTAGLLLHYSL